MTSPRPPISWTPCPYCGAKAHEPCRPKWNATAYPQFRGRVYPMGRYHAERTKAARP